jgi:hypothetical protein
LPTKNKKMKIVVRTLTLCGFLLLASTSHAQWGGGWGGDGGSDAGDTDMSDSASTDDDGGGWGSGGGGWGDDGGDMGGSGFKDPEPYKFKVADYKRFSPPYDTNREIIFYQGVVEDYDCLECAADSLYWRTKYFLTQYYGEAALKSYTQEDKKLETIKLLVRKPMLISYNKHSKVQSGTLEYTVTLQFRDGRYKYQFGNFVHEEAGLGNKNRTTRTYHEYYMKTNKGVINTDRYLLTADKEVKAMVAGMKKALKEPYNPIEAGEDDW